MTSISLREYLSIKRDADGLIVVDRQRLIDIREKFNEIYEDRDRLDDDLREEYVQKLIEQLELVEDEFCRVCLNRCVSESSDESAEFNVRDEVENNGTILNLIPTTDRIQSSPSSNSIISQQYEQIDKIICIIHQKSIKVEVNNFLKEFLFQQIDQSLVISNEPICDNRTHPLASNCILDLFIRQQLLERGSITSRQEQTEYRLVEPISLTDEFESWTFDHFHGLLDFWLIRENNVSFPSSWRLNENTAIEYRISNGSMSETDDPSTKTIKPPNTKSLDSFIRDICQIENNGMFATWYKALTTEENITSYAHLTNLNQNEWERISHLPMNALKTIKFYIDQEKQKVEETKTKQQQHTESRVDESYSKAEIRANLHMIKLYFIRQLRDIEGIKSIPRLDSYCVDAAFDEMRREGYEDDGLFDQMKLFFQPLTITEDELKIDPNILSSLNLEENQTKRKLTVEIRNFQSEYNQISSKTQQLQKEIDQIESTRTERYTQLGSDLKEHGNEYVNINIRQRRRHNFAYFKPNQHDQIYNAWKIDDNKLQEEARPKYEKVRVNEKLLQSYISEQIHRQNQIADINKSLSSMETTIDRRLVKIHRGFIMYGPPGTGKSVIMSKLAKKIGIAMLGPPLAAGELERPYVGQSEAIIRDICMRGNRLPHLMCCVSIDEIDSLAPKRDGDSSEGKVSKISVLLSVIEGIKDVPNLMFFSATNRLHMMDEAFLRRMSGKFFVGRPSAQARKRILDSIPKIILDTQIKQKLITATTNFSGAALKSLTSAIVVDYLAESRSKPNFQITEEQILELADRTARQFQLYLGNDTLPRLLLQNLIVQRQLLPKVNPSEQFHLSQTIQYTGKIIVSLLRDRSVRIETIAIHEKTNERYRYTIEYELTKTEENLQQLLERLTSYGNDRNVQLIQLIDLNLLSSQSAYDEKKIFETLKERYDECMQYKRSMIIYDLDSLIGVNKNESESSMGTSVSSSIVNQNIYTYVTSRFREAQIEYTSEKETMSMERWAVAVVRDPFLFKKFTADVNFTLTEKQSKEEDDEYQRSTNILFCVKCRETYVESDNKTGVCNYHDGFLYDNFMLNATQYTTTEVTKILKNEEYQAYSQPAKKDELEKRKTRFSYICCHATFQIGGSFHGCRKDKHGYSQITINQESNIPEDKLISQWETACKNNIKYNDRLKGLIQQRFNF